MKASTVNVIKLEPSGNMHLKNNRTGEVYDGFIYIAKSLNMNDFDEITEEEYRAIVKEKAEETEERSGENVTG